MPGGKVQLNSSGARKLNSSGALILSDGDPCCCQSNVCFTKWTISWDCSNSTWGSWTNAGDFCLDPATTSTARDWISLTGGTVCNYQQYVRKSPDVNCTTNADCTSSASAPATPTDTPTSDCLCHVCGCLHAIPFTARVTIAGTTSCTVCFTAADNTGSAKLTGSCDGTYDLERVSGSCAWTADVAGPTLDQDCFDLDCSFTNGPNSQVTGMTVRLQRVGANTYRIQVHGRPGATLYYDSGNFTWNDSDACALVGSGAQASILAGCVLPTGCAPTSAANGGTGAAVFLP